MDKNETQPNKKSKKELENNVEVIKKLLILLVNKMGVDFQDIAKVVGVSKSSVTKILNPKKYKGTKKEV